MAVGSLVCGILALVFGLIAPIGWVGAVLGVIGIILAVQGKKKQPEKASLCTAGLVLSIIGLVIGVIFYLACVACVKGTKDAIDDAVSSALAGS
ncbi:MAG: hypothetical protein IK106_00950 [Clostridiales bacterium]|nr:hypothetical protein [Clostridiales bacterium]MBR6255068.1 hypothetical protein [Clostridiales bacterium]